MLSPSCPQGQRVQGGCAYPMTVCPRVLPTSFHCPLQTQHAWKALHEAAATHVRIGKQLVRRCPNLPGALISNTHFRPALLVSFDTNLACTGEAHKGPGSGMRDRTSSGQPRRPARLRHITRTDEADIVATCSDAEHIGSCAVCMPCLMSCHIFIAGSTTSNPAWWMSQLPRTSGQRDSKSQRILGLAGSVPTREDMVLSLQATCNACRRTNLNPTK